MGQSCTTRKPLCLLTQCFSSGHRRLYSPCFHLPGFHYRLFLTHSHLGVSLFCGCPLFVGRARIPSATLHLFDLLCAKLSSSKRGQVPAKEANEFFGPHEERAKTPACWLGRDVLPLEVRTCGFVSEGSTLPRYSFCPNREKVAHQKTSRTLELDERTRASTFKHLRVNDLLTCPLPRKPGAKEFCLRPCGCQGAWMGCLLGRPTPNWHGVPCWGSSKTARKGGVSKQPHKSRRRRHMPDTGGFRLARAGGRKLDLANTQRWCQWNGEVPL